MQGCRQRSLRHQCTGRSLCRDWSNGWCRGSAGLTSCCKRPSRKGPATMTRHQGRGCDDIFHLPKIGGVPTTPDPDTSAKVSRYKWEPYRDTNWWCIYYFLPRGGHTLAKVCHRNGRCIAILFKSIGVRGCFDSPDLKNMRN